MQNYDAATEDFGQALDQAGPELSGSDRRALCEELRKAEDRAKAERSKTKNYYAVLGVFDAYCITLINTLVHACGIRATERLYGAGY